MVNHLKPRSAIVFLGILAVFSITSCSSIGTLRTYGTDVMINGHKVTQGTEKKVYAKDKITTGEKSHAVLRFKDGDELTIGENTDPVIEWVEKFVEDRLGCELGIEFRSGKAHLNGKRKCISIPLFRFAVSSEINLEIPRDGSNEKAIITVIKGSVLFDDEKKSKIMERQQAIIKGAEIEVRKDLSENELCQILAWKNKIEGIDKPCPPPLRVSPPVPPPVAHPVPPPVAHPVPPPVPPPVPRITPYFGFVFFKFDNYRIQGEASTTLEEVRNFLRNNPRSTILIEGHTDYIGSKSYNKKLSQRRADAVKRWLIDNLGIAEAPLEIGDRAHGETRPCRDNRTAEGRKANRRAEICVIPYGGENSIESGRTECNEQRKRRCE